MVTISTIQFKRGKKEALERALVGKNILLSGEPVFEIDTNKFKIGDGKSEYKDLPYISDSVQSGNLFFAETIYEFPKVGEDDKGKPIFEKDVNKIEWWINDFEVINGLIDNIVEELEDTDGENEF